MARNDRNQIPNILKEDARIVFRNFAGKEGQYNRAGDRNFCLLLDEDMRADLEPEGWNIKYLKPRSDDDEPQPYIEVKVKFGNIPPKILMITGQGKTLLDEETVGVLDFAEIETVDVIVRPYEWQVNDKAGVAAYLKTMYVTLREDEFASKYYDIPDSAASAMTMMDDPWQEPEA